ncbi:MAG: hypothetical protein ACOX6J_04705 [Oscillospiraceae bacterium]
MKFKDIFRYIKYGGAALVLAASVSIASSGLTSRESVMTMASGESGETSSVSSGSHGTIHPFGTYTIVIPSETRTLSVQVYDPAVEQAYGSALSASRGVAYFQGHKETYYNLDMSVIVSVAHARGIEGEYWINDLGCKMLGDYIMVAANYTVHPYGSLVETSLGMGIVVDTGGFASESPYQIDIATSW